MDLKKFTFRGKIMRLKMIAAILLAGISCTIIAKGVDSQALIFDKTTTTQHHEKSQQVD
jgi:hypothetical protein